MKKTEKLKPETTRTSAYAYYSRVLEEAFDTVEELAEAEEAHYAKLAAKEAKIAEKRSDAAEVEKAFKALNAARKAYKENLVTLNKMYKESLVRLKTTFEDDLEVERKNLAATEEAYAAALKAFSDKYPEGYHITLKDGDFETTISQETSRSNKSDSTWTDEDVLEKLFSLFF